MTKVTLWRVKNPRLFRAELRRPRTQAHTDVEGAGNVRYDARRRAPTASAPRGKLPLRARLRMASPVSVMWRAFFVMKTDDGGGGGGGVGLGGGGGGGSLARYEEEGLVSDHQDRITSWC